MLGKPDVWYFGLEVVGAPFRVRQLKLVLFFKREKSKQRTLKGAATKAKTEKGAVVNLKR
jgi:hypothetical protein